ncbi:acyl transferase domain-containing protein/acyl carrier protein [Saccharothrix tamanrassetensis]|uniref:Acyl transferase domain-containing protein/acyl carrier protein n=1 Tax=Saccharothrix tamanrassetensis TaxID=1051531 RepID=A0A841CBP4_9PSEU|nr:SDR family NAD(P)-dependent oxidoreductase [Saccharothrix tamanrassetensis]MBB5953774.1 acyl transferase domain-containing protein/acyl carrier protein [Saccharothrix tamanrassetensis]
MTQPTENAHAVVLSAAGDAQLRRSAERLRDHVAAVGQDLADVAYTSQVGRMPLAHRLAVRCRDPRELLAGLDAFLRGGSDDGVRHGVASPAVDGPDPATEWDAAVAWVAGREIAWRRYWPTPGRRVSLPTYPFRESEPAPRSAPVGAAAGATAESVLSRYLVDVYAEVSGVPAASVDAHLPLTDQGLTSYLIGKLNVRLEQDLGERSRTLFFEHATIAGLAAALSARGRTVTVPAARPEMPVPVARKEEPATVTLRRREEPAATVSRRDDHESTDIAVIGISGRYPQSPDLARFWENLVQGNDCVTPHPADRARPGWPVHLMEGGYLDQVDRFDPLLFGITPRDAALMDPQERLFLEVTWEALESAGYTRTRLRDRHRSSVAVYAGAMWNEYPIFGAEQTLLGSPQDSGATLGGIANRVSYFFDLHGPSLTVDTMCSSALVALDLAVQCLRRGETELAISGAASLSLHPNKFIQQHRMTLTSSDRRCRSFGAHGDGFVPSEGVGVVVLKPLDRALADGDPVHAVIRGTAVVHAGRTNGYIVPSPVAQAEVVSRALRAARTEPAEVGYVEAHGAGTALGDPVEIDGLTRAYGDLPAGSVAIGSVKSTIGHAEAAAGLAGLTKVVLQLRHGVLAPSLHAEELNPNVEWDRVPFRVQRERAEWRGPRVAGVSSFGAGGTIAHAVVAAPPVRRSAPSPGPQLVVLSGYDEERLAEVVHRLVAFLRREPSHVDLVEALRRIASGDAGPAAEYAAGLLAGTGVSLADIAYTLQVGREPLRQRLAVVVDDVAALCDRLENYRTDPRVLLGRAPAAVDPTGVVLPGAGESLEEIARHWIEGGAVDWERLHEAGRSIVDLPTYPFARVRCWLPELATAAPPALQAQPVHQAQPVLRTEPAVQPQPVLRAQPVPAQPVVAPVMAGPVPPSETPLYEKVWELDPMPSPGAPLGPFVCVGGDPAVISELGGLPVRDEAELAAVLARTPEVNGLLSLPDGPDWETRLAILRALLLARPRSPLRVIHVAGDDVRTAGFVKMLGAEYARVTATVLDTDSPRRPQTDIRAEWGRPDPFGEVRYREGRRYRPRLDLVTAPYVPLRCDPDAAYLVTGGTRGTGALVARHLADHGARAIALIGVRRSEDAVRALESRGVRVLLHSGGFAGVEAFLDRVRAELGPLRGVVHCAGVAGQGAPAFVHKDPADVRAVLAPKLDGFETLAGLCATDRLAFFLVFSSVCATVPALAAGVSDYAAANTAVDELVRSYVRDGRTEFRAVDWPQWSQTGSTKDVPNPCAPAGIGPLDDAAGLRVVDRVLALPTGAVVLPCPPLGAPPDPEALLSVRPGVVPAPETGPPAWLVGLFSEALGIPVPDLDPTVEFGDLGVDSVLLGELLVRIEEQLGTHLDPATLLLHPTLDRLSEYLGLTAEPQPAPAADQQPVPVVDQQPVAAVEQPSVPAAEHPPVPAVERSPVATVAQELPVTSRPVPGPAPVADGRIAVIGMACRFPGATTLPTLWDNLLDGRCAVTEIPASRWDHRRWWSPEIALGRTISKWGGFVDDIELFDPEYFDMDDDEARCLDPAIRMFLEGTAECIAEAGYDQAELRGRRVAVVAGARLSDYGRRVPVRADVLRSDQNFIAARVAHQFDLRGPNLVVDSACSSSLVALQTACRSLLAGESELAVAGGVEVLLDEHVYLDLSAARALSPTGRCRTFDERADGFVPAEGCGVVLLKPLAAAIADGDRVHAVIEAVSVNNDGHTMGVTTPNPVAQADVVRQALAAAGRAPAEVGMLEAHGTGTMIGDPIELRGLNDVFGGLSSGRIEVGSVKSNLGHLLSAAGMAGLFKVVLSLEHGRIPPTLFCDRPNPRFDFARSPLHPTTEAVDWPAGVERVAGLSSFGLGGTNAHMVVSAAPATASRRVPLAPPEFRRRRLWLEATSEAPPAAPRQEPLDASLMRLSLVTRG